MGADPKYFLAFVVSYNQLKSLGPTTESISDNLEQNVLSALSKLVGTIGATAEQKTKPTISNGRFAYRSPRVSKKIARDDASALGSAKQQPSNRTDRERDVHPGDDVARNYTLDEVERKYKISRSGIYKLIKSGRLPDVKPEHGKRVVPRDALEALFAARR